MQSMYSSTTTTTNCRRSQTKRQYSSVKYKALPNNGPSAKEKFLGKQSLHHTQSSPLNSGSLRATYGSTGLVCCNRTTGGLMSNSSTMDRKVSQTSNSSRLLVHENSLERRLLSPNKLAIITGNGALPQTTRSRVLDVGQKHKLMALAPPSLHISFDACEPERRNEHHLMPVSLSSDNFRGYRHSIAIPRHHSPSPLRRDMQRQRQRILEQSEIAEISSEFMRTNGLIQQFKGIMTDPMKTSSFSNKTASESIDIDGAPIQNVFTKQDSSNMSARTPTSRHLSTETNKNPSINGESQLANLIDLKLQVSYRLRRRNELFNLRKKLADYSFAVAVLGIILMIIENELTGTRLVDIEKYKGSPSSYVLKSLIVLFTLVLLALIISYHAVEIKLFMSDNSCEDWRVGLTRRRVITLTLELIACSVCPVPGSSTFQWYTVHSNGSTKTTSDVPIDVLLSIPMFLRCYLLCRIMLLHSRLLSDASSRSIGALNRITYTAKLVLKILMTLSPGTVLLVFTASFWLIAAWIMSLCERWHLGDDVNDPIVEASKFQNYLNSLWLIAITSLTVGYGDITPNTYCGRAVSVICGIMGAGTSSLVVAVVAKKLELSRAEQLVHNFMMDSQLTKRLKNAAANVLRETWFIYKNRRLMNKMDTAAKIRFHQRKFLAAIYEMRKVKIDQRKLNENNVTVSDMAKTSNAMYELMSDMILWQDSVEEKISTLQSHCINLESQVMQVNASLLKLPDLISLKLLQEIAEQSAQNSLRAPSLLSLNNP